MSQPKDTTTGVGCWYLWVMGLKRGKRGGGDKQGY